MADVELFPVPGPVPDAIAAFAATARVQAPHSPPYDAAAVGGKLSEHNPWFANGIAQGFWIPGKTVLIGMREPNRLIEGEAAAFCGFFDTVGDADADAAVFAAFRAWAAGQGAVRAYGPIDLSTYFDYRLLTGADGEDLADVVPFPGEPYNPAHYPAAFTRDGWEVAMRYDSRFTPIEACRAYADRGRPLIAALEAEGYRFEALTPELWQARLPELHPLADEAFKENFAYTPLPYDLFALACGDAWIRRHVAQTSVLVTAPQGEIACVMLVQPHYGPLLCGTDGLDPVPAGQLSAEVHLPVLAQAGPLRLLHKTVAVAPAHRGRKLQNASAAWTIDAADAAGFDVSHWVAATARLNNLSQRGYADAAGTIRHEYALFTTAL